MGQHAPGSSQCQRDGLIMSCALMRGGGAGSAEARPVIHRFIIDSAKRGAEANNLRSTAREGR
jgi:hypothetical protein